MDNIKCVLYARVSSREQEDTGYSLPAQEKLLKEYSHQRELKIEKKFSVTESASGKKQRQVFGEMLEVLKKKNIKIIVCEKIDRLTRNLKDAVKVNEWINEDPEREVHFAKENWILTRESKSNEKFIWNIRVSVSQYYTDNLSEEVKKGQKEKIAQGWLPTRPPLGYKTIGEKGHKIHILDEVKAPLVKKMFEFYATGDYSLKKLVNQMYNLGLRTNAGNRFVKSRLATTLGDPFYFGKLRWNNEVSDGKQEPLISKDLFDAVQNVLKSKNTPKYSKHIFLFKGLIKCEECGGRITWETHRNIIYGHCNHYRNCKQKVWHKELDINERVVDILDKLQIKQSGIYDWIKKALKESHKDKIEFHNSSIEALEQRLAQIQNRLDRIYDDKLDGRINEDFYQRKLNQFSQEKDNVLNSIKKHTNSDENYFKLSLNFFELAQKAKEIYVSIKEVEKKRSLLRLMFKDFLLSDDGFEFEPTEAFKLIAQATNLSNCLKTEKTITSDGKIFEHTQKATESGLLCDFAVTKSGNLVMESLEPRFDFRTSRNPLLQERFGDNTLKSRPLLRGEDSNL